jgi:hypothetical protein
MPQLRLFGSILKLRREWELVMDRSSGMVTMSMRELRQSRRSPMGY